jgi:hypothetical protein
MQAPVQPPPNLPLDQKLSLDEVGMYGRYPRIQYKQTLRKIPRTLREIRNADASMDALRAQNNSWLTVPVKQLEAVERVNAPGMGGISFKEELQQVYGAPSRMEKYAARVGKNAMNVAEEYQEGGPVTEGTGTGKKSYPVFTPFTGGKRRASRKSRRTKRRATRRTKRRASRKSRRN